MYDNITPQVWEYLRIKNSKITDKILKALDNDICSFYSDGKSITLERTFSGAGIPNYLFNYMVKHNNDILIFVLRGKKQFNIQYTVTADMEVTADNESDARTEFFSKMLEDGYSGIEINDMEEIT